MVIVGGGFGGLRAARALRREAVDVTLVDRRNHHVFQPLLYQVATAALSPADIAQPIRSVLRDQPNVEVLLGEVTAVDPTAHQIVVDGKHVDYDYLVIAAGASHAYFGYDEWEPFAPGLKTLDDALDIRRRILLAFEQAEAAERLGAGVEPDGRRAALMTFVVVGGGPTGVELAGAIAEIARHSLPRDFRHIDSRDARVVLVEAGERLLASFPADLGDRAGADLRHLGVEVRTGAAVTAIDDTTVTIGDEVIAAATVIWAAGVRAAPLGASLGTELDRAGRVVVAPDLSVPGHPDVFVVGDMAALAGGDDRQLPGVAQVAMQGGHLAARNIVRRIAGKPTQPFRYRDLGNLATIGRNAAIADLRGRHLTGFVAFVVWAVVHIFNLIGFRNRLLVGLQWLWQYVTAKRGARLITGGARSITGGTRSITGGSGPDG